MPKSVWSRFKDRCVWFFCMPAYPFENRHPRKRHHPRPRPPTPPPKDSIDIKKQTEVGHLGPKLESQTEDGLSEEETARYTLPSSDIKPQINVNYSLQKTTGIRFKVAEHQAEVVDRAGDCVTCAEAVLDTLWQPTTIKSDYETRQSEYIKCKEIYQTSMTRNGPETDFSTFLPKRNGFVHTVLQAYNQHHELIIRPDDVWIAILSQLSLYVNANADALRPYFVDHEGKQQLRLEYDHSHRHTLDYNEVARDFSDFLREKIKDPDLVDAILPNFSTTSQNDTTISSVIMMSTLKEYFSYEVELRCGLPAVTLLGEKADYEIILTKLDKLEELGIEAKAFTSLLRPIIYGFIATFDAISAGVDPNMDFWGKICHEHSMGSGSNVLSGWLTAFCAWDKDGKWQLSTLDSVIPPWMRGSDYEDILYGDQGDFDASLYGGITMDNIPIGFADVEVLVIEGNDKYDCMMVAGHVGARMCKTDQIENTLQPSPQWFMFEVERVKEEGLSKW